MTIDQQVAAVQAAIPAIHRVLLKAWGDYEAAGQLVDGITNILTDHKARGEEIARLSFCLDQVDQVLSISQITARGGSYRKALSDLVALEIQIHDDPQVSEIAANRRAERDRITQERDALLEDKRRLERTLLEGRIRCHIAPTQEDLERNKIKEPEGEKLRAELIAWIEKNGIVSLVLDTPKHVASIDIVGKLPPRITPLLTLWGSIYATDPTGMRKVMYGQQTGEAINAAKETKG